MKGYVDGFVLVVPKKKLGEYREMAQGAGKMWRKYGALDYKECVGDDLSPNTQGMKIFPFPKMIKLRRGETVVFSYILYKSKAHRNKVNAKVMKEMDKEMAKYKDKPMPFDMKRMAYGGFKVIVDEKR
jgi:alkaline phosphatase